MTFAISRSVYNTGIEPFPFLQPAVDASWFRFKKRLEVAFEDDLEAFLKKVLPEHKMEYVMSLGKEKKTVQPRDSKGRFTKRT